MKIAFILQLPVSFRVFFLFLFPFFGVDIHLSIKSMNIFWICQTYSTWSNISYWITQLRRGGGRCSANEHLKTRRRYRNRNRKRQNSSTYSNTRSWDWEIEQIRYRISPTISLEKLKRFNLENRMEELEFALELGVGEKDSSTSTLTAAAAYSSGGEWWYRWWCCCEWCWLLY